MESVREYLLSVTAAAVLCGIVNSLTGEKGSLSGLQRMICGLFLCFTVLSPLTGLQIPDISEFTDSLLSEGELAVQEGEDYRNQTLRQIITDETRAYIMDKARSYGADIQAEVILSQEEPPVPEYCTITGAVSPYVKQQLSSLLESQLGIAKENQTWIQ